MAMTKVVNSRVPKTVRHGTSLHRICLKLLVDSSPSRLESQKSVCRPTLELLGLSPGRLKSQASVRRPFLKIFGSSTSHLSFDQHKKCWLTSQPSVLRQLQPLTTHVLDVCPLTVKETKMLPIVCTTQNYNRSYILIKLLTTYFITQWRLAILLVLSVISNLSIITMPTAIDNIVDGFPFPTIPPIVGTPAYNTIAKVNLKLSSNSASVQSNLGCGTLGLLQLTDHPPFTTLYRPSPLSCPSTPDLYPSSQRTPLAPKSPNFSMLSTPPPYSSTGTIAPTRFFETSSIYRRRTVHLPPPTQVRWIRHHNHP